MTEGLLRFRGERGEKFEERPLRGAKSKPEISRLRRWSPNAVQQPYSNGVRKTDRDRASVSDKSIAILEA